MTVADADALEELLLDANYEHGWMPEVVGYDRVHRPVMAWLNEDGGDSTRLEVVLLCGFDAARSEPTETAAADLLYPLSLMLPASWAVSGV